MHALSQIILASRQFWSLRAPLATTEIFSIGQPNESNFKVTSHPKNTFPPFQISSPILIFCGQIDQTLTEIYIYFMIKKY